MYIVKKMQEYNDFATMASDDVIAICGRERWMMNELLFLTVPVSASTPVSAMFTRVLKVKTVSPRQTWNEVKW